MKQFISIAFILTVFLAVYSCNENRKAKNFNEKTQVDGDALAFIKNGIQGGAAEVKLSEIALKNSQNKDVQDFAKMMINDHTQAGNELKKIAGDQFVGIPDSLDTQHAQIAASLSKKTGTEFDKAYAQVMVQDHEAAIKLFESVANNKRKDINDFADKTLPKLHEHLKEANALCAKFN